MEKYIRPEIECIKIGCQDMMVSISDTNAWGPACTRRYDDDFGIDEDGRADDGIADINGLW